MPVKKVLILVGDFVEDYEVMIAYQALEMVGHKPLAASPGKKAGERIKTSVHDFEGDQTYTERLGHYFTLNATFSKIKAKEIDALLIPGGRAPEFLRLDKNVLDITRKVFDAGKPVAAICHGLLVLATAGVLKGRSCTAYDGCGPDIVAVGGRFRSLSPEKVLVDGNLITSPAWPGTGPTCRKLIDQLGTKITT